MVIGVSSVTVSSRGFKKDLIHMAIFLVVVCLRQGSFIHFSQRTSSLAGVVLLQTFNHKFLECYNRKDQYSITFYLPLWQLLSSHRIRLKELLRITLSQKNVLLKMETTGNQRRVSDSSTLSDKMDVVLMVQMELNVLLQLRKDWYSIKFYLPLCQLLSSSCHKIRRKEQLRLNLLRKNVLLKMETGRNQRKVSVICFSNH